MPSSDGLAIIVLNWNRREETRRCVESCPVTERIYVLDNGCSESQAHVPSGRNRETVIKSATNIGYAAGVNLAASRAIADGAEWLLLLNNDATLGRGASKALVARAPPPGSPPCVRWSSTRRAVASGPSEGGSVRERVGCRPDITAGIRTPSLPPRRMSHSGPAHACWCRLALWRRSGDFDTTYFAYWEETDWCRRARDAGYRVVTCPAARAVHVGGVSSMPSTRLYLMVRNALLYMRRHAARRDLIRFVPVFFLWTIPSWSLRPFLADPKRTARVVGRAIAWHGHRSIPEPDLRLPPAPAPRKQSGVENQ